VAKKVPNPIDVHVGSRVRLRRMLIGMSQEKLGELLGLTFQQVQKYEKGTNRIGASRLYQIAQFLGVPVQFFFEDLTEDMAKARTGDVPGFGERDNAPYVMDFVSSAEGLELNRSYSRIADPRVRKRILELVRCLAQEPSEGLAAADLLGPAAADDDAESGGSRLSPATIKPA
jgi:transcriptional regulator with XRE-family HTH domain